MTWKIFLLALGIVFVIEGLPYLAFPDKMKALVEQLPSIPDRVLRLLGLAALIAGFAIIVYAKGLLVP